MHGIKIPQQDFGLKMQGGELMREGGGGGAYLRDLFLVKLTEHSLLCILFLHFTALTFPKMWFSQKKLFLLIDCRYI